jgi:thiol-disulfide isomerase/thioredoxin
VSPGRASGASEGRQLSTRALLALVLVAVGCMVRGGDALPTSLPEVPLAPAATGAARVTLAEVAAGRPMVVDFFATWCTPCRDSMPRLQAFADERAGAGLVVVGVNVGEDLAEVEPFVRELGVRYPIYLDRDFRLADAVGASRVPALLVVAGDGRILHRGHDLDEQTRAAVEKALAPAR